jgi:hypothetical protein
MTSGTFLVDLDVALRDESDPAMRGPFDWHRVGEDSPNVPVILVVQALAAAGHRIVYLSGRQEICRRATGVWIAGALPERRTASPTNAVFPLGAVLC